MKQTRRSGFSLLEVMLATTVLLGSVIVLSHIAFVGMAHMDSAQQYAAAQLVCQARMNEMLAGARPIEEVSRQRIRELPGWRLTVKVGSTSRPGLLAIEVTAAEKRAGLSVETGGGSAAAPQQVLGAGKRFTLVRWIAEPEGSELSSSFPGSQTAVPVDVPMEPSFFDDSMTLGESLLPEEPMPLDESFVPEEPSMFDEPLPEL